MTKPAKGYLTPREVADLLMVSPITVRQWAQKGWLEAQTTPGGHRRFLHRHVEVFARHRGLTLNQGDDDSTRVLIVDDDEQFSNFLVEALSELAESVTTEVAQSGFEAGQKVHTFSPHIVLLDLMMPGLDGFAVCRQIKESPVTRGIDVIAVTGFHTPENADRIISAGARACLGKPVDLEMLTREMGLRLARAQA